MQNMYDINYFLVVSLFHLLSVKDFAGVHEPKRVQAGFYSPHDPNWRLTDLLPKELLLSKTNTVLTLTLLVLPSQTMCL